MKIAIDLDHTITANSQSIEFFKVLTHLLIAEHSIYILINRSPGTEQEIADKMEISSDKLKFINEIISDTTSLDVQISQDEGTSVLLDLIIDENSPLPSDKTNRTIIKDILHNLFEKELDHRETIIIKKRFGLEDGESYTLEEIGREIGITRERVRQIEHSALKKLHEGLKITKDKYFL